MKLVIAGSRNWIDYERLEELADQLEITEIISGGAKGADQLGERYAKDRGIPIKQFIPNWARWGKAAGMYRNVDMAEYCDMGIILWDSESRGTLHMIDIMKRLNKEIIYG